MATPHFSATEAAAEAFGAGGNALDAALAAATTLAVVYPHMCGVGGDLIALVRDPSGRTRCIMSAGAAPSAVDVSAVRARAAGSARPLRGPDSITVPGAVAGWESLHSSGAALPWPAGFSHAITFAREGVRVSRDLAATLSLDGEQLRHDPGLANVFFSGDSSEGSTLVQAALGSTLDALAAGGGKEFYDGDIGRRYVDGLSARGCTISREDLANHRADDVQPLSGSYGGRTLLTAPPPSQGFALLRILRRLQQLAPGVDPNLGSEATAIAQLFSEATGLRDGELADPSNMRVSAMDLIVADAPPRAGTARGERGTGDTISLVCADASGWTVSLIQSLYDAFGSGILEPDTGIVAHDRGACFTLQPGHPNELAPRKRPAHTLMPVMVERDSALELVTGTMGGEAQPQINAQNLVRALDMKQAPLEALSAPRWTLDGTVATVEEGVPSAVVRSLTDAGFTIERTGRHSGDLGHSNMIACTASGFTAAADPRADGSAAAGP